MTVSLIVAASLNNVIGKDNRLLWHLPNDMAFFKNTTWAMPVLMGRKTFESLGKPLKGRTNIVISRERKVNPEGIVVVSDLESGIRAAEQTDARECFVIGGGQIYKLAMPMARKIYLTRVRAELAGDAFFPPFSEDDWKLEGSTSFEADARHAYAYRFEIWKRK